MCFPVCGICGNSAHFAIESYFLPSPSVALNMRGACPGNQGNGGGRWWANYNHMQVLINSILSPPFPSLQRSVFSQLLQLCFNLKLLVLTPFIRPVEVRNITLGGEWLYSLFPRRTWMRSQKFTSRGISISFTLLWTFLFEKKEYGIIVWTPQHFTPREQSWLKLPMPRRVGTVQTMAGSLVHDCLCWVQL